MGGRLSAITASQGDLSRRVQPEASPQRPREHVANERDVAIVGQLELPVPQHAYVLAGVALDRNVGDGLRSAGKIGSSKVLSTLPRCVAYVFGSSTFKMLEPTYWMQSQRQVSGSARDGRDDDWVPHGMGRSCIRQSWQSFFT